MQCPFYSRPCFCVNSVNNSQFILEDGKLCLKIEEVSGTQLAKLSIDRGCAVQIIRDPLREVRESLFSLHISVQTVVVMRSDS